jgi:hypothetical protein
MVFLKINASIYHLKPDLISACPNDVIYMSGLEGTYKSVDEGENWSLII